jgi:hypothetical protein
MTRAIFSTCLTLQETKIKGYINVVGYRMLADENIDPGRYGFKLLHDSDRSHFFSSDEQMVIREWMRALMKATIDRDYTSAFLVVIPSATRSNVCAHRARGILSQRFHHPPGSRAGHEPGSTSAFTNCPGGNSTCHATGEHQSAVYA